MGLTGDGVCEALVKGFKACEVDTKQKKFQFGGRVKTYSLLLGAAVIAVGGSFVRCKKELGET